MDNSVLYDSNINDELLHKAYRNQKKEKMLKKSIKRLETILLDRSQKKMKLTDTILNIDIEITNIVKRLKKAKRQMMKINKE